MTDQPQPIQKVKKPFFERWKEGIQKVTPLQQVKASMPGYFLVLLGICLGIYFSVRAHQWWLMTILIGSLIVSGTQILGVLQRYYSYKNMEVMMHATQTGDR